MELHVEQTLFEYLEKYGYLFENDSSILLEEIKEEEIKKKYKKKLHKLNIKKEKMIQHAKDVGMDVGRDVSDTLLDKVESRVKKILFLYSVRKQMLDKQQFIELTKVRSGRKGLVASGAGLASLLIFSAFKLYTDTKKSSNSLCLNTTGSARKNCFKKLTKHALSKRLTFLKSAISKCDYTKDPVSCKSKIDKEILKVQEKIKDVSSDIGSRLVKKFE